MVQTLANQSRLLLAGLAGLDFDIAMFAEHELDDGQGDCKPLFCPRLVLGADGVEIPSPQRWQPLLPEVEHWGRGQEPWLDDLRLFATVGNDDYAYPGVGRLLELGIRSLIGLAISEGDKLVASILLGSSREQAYRREALDRLTTGRAEAAGRELLSAHRERRALVLREMRGEFTTDLRPVELATGLARRVAEALDWEFVGIYRVDGRFELLGSCDRTPGRVFKLRNGYTQALSEGMLGACLAAQACLRADDVTAIPPPHNYKPVDGFPARSALCYPVSAGGRIEWMVECSSRALAAFRGPDRRLLDDLVWALQANLELWFETRLSRAVFDGIAQSVLVVDRDGTIQRANCGATAIFGPALAGRTPASLAFDDLGAATLEPMRPARSARVRMRTHTGQSRPMLLTVRLSDDWLGRWVVQFVDADDQQVLAGLQYARRTVQEVAAQARGPLMLARALLGKVDKAVADGSQPSALAAELSRISESLGRADLSYERLARAVSGKDQLDLSSLLENVRAAMAVSGMEVEIAPTREAALVRGRPADLVSALSAFLRKVGEMSIGPRLVVVTEVRDDHVSITFPGSGLTPGPGDPAGAADLDPFASLDAAARAAASGASVPPVDIRWLAAAEGWHVSQPGELLEVRLPRARAEPGSWGSADG